MNSRLSKKIRFVFQLKNMYSYIFHRFLVKIRTLLKLPPVYPYEKSYQFDEDVQRKLAQIRQVVPDEDRGDNPVFRKNWKSVYEREEKARNISENIRRIAGFVNDPGDASWARAIREIGYAGLIGKKLSTDKVDRIVEYFNRQKVYPSHVAHFALEKPKSKEEVKKKSSFGSYDMATILKAPYIAQILSDKEVIGNIADYFGCLPTVSSVNVFWAFASGDGKPRGPQNFHRDVDDVKTCTMFINLTDTKEDEGAHCYIRKTHTIERLKSVFSDEKNKDLPKELNPWNRNVTPEDFFSLPLNGYSFEKLYEHFFKEQAINLYGERGTVLVTDNYGIHRGIPSRTFDRLILWVSYSLTATHTQSADVKLLKRAAYSDIKDSVEDSSVNRYVLRNVVKFV